MHLGAPQAQRARMASAVVLLEHRTKEELVVGAVGDVLQVRRGRQRHEREVDEVARREHQRHLPREQRHEPRRWWSGGGGVGVGVGRI